MSTTRLSPSSPSPSAVPDAVPDDVAPPAGPAPARPLTAPPAPPAPAGAVAPPAPAVALSAAAGRVRRGATAVLALLRGALADAAPQHGYQRAMYAAAVVMLASGLVHVGVWAVDGGPWEGAVSWRKPILFGISFGLFLLSTGWVQGVLPRSRAWGWATTALIAGGGLAEVALITAQRWRGVASHFNVLTPVDALLFGLMGATIAVFGAGITALALWAALRLRRPAPTAVAVLVGLALVLVASAVGGDLITRGLASTEATGVVPSSVVIGVAGSGKLAHAVALHGLQVLGVLALLLGRSGLSPARRTHAMAASATGYVVATALVTSQAYAGRSMLEIGAAAAIALTVATLAVMVPFAVVLGAAATRGAALRDAVRGRGRQVTEEV